MHTKILHGLLFRWIYYKYYSKWMMKKFCILERLGCKTSSWSYFPLNILVSIACVASVSDWFRSKENPVLAAREMKREPKKKRGGRVSLLSSPPPPRSFTCTIFRAVFDSRSSFFAPKPNGNACYAGYMRGLGRFRNSQQAFAQGVK